MDRQRKLERFIYQLFHCLLLWVIGHGLPPYTRAHALKRNGTGSGPGGARSQPANTNAVSFKGFVDLLHFRNYFCLSELTSSFRAKWPEDLHSEWFPSTWPRNHRRVLGLRVDPEHFDLEVFPEHLEPRCVTRALGLGIFSSFISLSQSTSSFDWQRFFTR